MKVQPLKTLALGVFLAAVAGTGVAAPQQADAPQSIAEILQFQHALRAKLEAPSGEYSRFNESSIHQMESAQDKVFHMLAGVNSLDQLNAEQKTDVSNSLDEVKAVLLANDGNRLICHREKKTGTNLSERRCETIAGRAARRQDADRFMLHDRLNTPPHNGGG